MSTGINEVISDWEPSSVEDDEIQLVILFLKI